jgi:hypothetical protein
MKMANKQIGEAARLLGKRSYEARLKKFGIKRLQEIARQNGKLGGRPVAKGESR